MKRSRALRPLSSEHHQALLVAFQMRKALEGHPEAAGAPRDLPGLVSLARRFEGQVFGSHAAAEEALLSDHLAGPDRARLVAEHGELKGLVEHARTSAPGEQRAALAAFADLLERHVRWEERELFPYAEAHLDAAELAVIGGELERRLVLAGQGTRGARR
jgi:hemerythrin-like domain-containing protein